MLRHPIIRTIVLAAVGVVVPAAVAAQTAPLSRSTPGIPPVAERPQVAGATLAVRGFRVTGVTGHPDVGITPASMQAIADTGFRHLASGRDEPRLRLDQMQAVADVITRRYREAGFVVATAVVPVQRMGEDHIVELRVIEGRVGKVIVQGAEHYRPGVLAAPLQRLQGRAVRAGEVSSAMLYTSDLPGVSVSSVLQPGAGEGETDLVLTAQEQRRPVQFSLGGNNHGTETIGRYRALAGLAWNNPLGFGDRLAASYVHALDPRASQQGSLSYAFPLAPVPGLSLIAGYNRSELEVNNGEFTALDIKGPTRNAYLGADWKFVNTRTLQLQGSLRYLRERSRLEALGLVLSEQEFDVAEAGLALRRTDVRWRGVDLLQASLRQALDDRSASPDFLYPAHDSHFTVARLSYSRLQYLAPTQRLLLRLSGQYTEDALTPLEQFSLGGPDTVRAYPVSEALGDRAWAGTLEYRVDAPGFADVASPFGGRPWRELLELGLFVDHGRTWPAGGNTAAASTFSGAGVSLGFRLPQFHELQLQLSAALPTSSADASDERDGVRVYASFGLTF